jgi:hypothetical protein
MSFDYFQRIPLNYLYGVFYANMLKVKACSVATVANAFEDTIKRLSTTGKDSWLEWLIPV